MNTSSINGFSAGSLQSMLADQLTSNNLTSSTSKNSKNAEPSPFAQLLSDAGSGSSAATSGNASQLLNQLVSNFQTSGIQNQGQSLDPNSIGA